MPSLNEVHQVSADSEILAPLQHLVSKSCRLAMKVNRNFTEFRENVLLVAICMFLRVVLSWS